MRQIAKELKEKGNQFLKVNNFKEAIKCYQQALILDPNYTDVYNNLGVAYLRKNDEIQAIKNFKRAIEINKQYTVSYINLAVVYLNKNCYKKAESLLRQSLKINKKIPEAYYNLGIIFLQQKKLKKAKENFKKAIELRGDYAKAISNLGVVLEQEKKYFEDKRLFSQTKNLLPNADSYYHLGVSLKKQKKIKEAISCFEHTIRLNPSHRDAYAHLISQLLNIGQWSHLEELKKDLKELDKKAIVFRQRPGTTPFMSLYLDDNPKDNLMIAKAWSDYLCKLKIKTNPVEKKPLKSFRLGKKIRVGYLSNTFHDHPVGEILINVLRHHNRERFEFVLYSYDDKDTSLYQFYVENFGHRFIDIKDLNTSQAVQKIVEDKIDILVDLNGYTQEGKFKILAFHPALIQVSWLGFLGTTGASFIDYLIADETVIPKEETKFFTEKIVYLPNTYQPIFHPRLDSYQKPQKKDFGLPEKGIVFSSFCSSYTIEPIIFSVWMEILKAVANSVLWLRKTDQSAMENLRDFARTSGVDEQRLIFADNIPLKQHLARLQLVDIVLDTRIYQEGVVTSNALWVGVPVITILGKHLASRTSASMLKAIGMEELIVTDLNQYKDLAIKLATHPKLLQSIKKKISLQQKTAAVFNIKKFVFGLEKAYQTMGQIFKMGLTPKEIAIKEDKILFK